MARKRDRNSGGAARIPYDRRGAHTPYTHNPKPPPATYTDPATGVLHRTDGTCHDACRDWR